MIVLDGEKKNRANDLTNRRFGRLVAVKSTGVFDPRKGQLWECECKCGNICIVSASSLLENEVRSCGCLKANQDKINLHPDYLSMFAGGTNIGKIKEVKIQANNTSGVPGVSWHRKTRKWVARITFKSKTISLGYYDRLEDAAKAREAAEGIYFEKYLESQYHP